MLYPTITDYLEIIERPVCFNTLRFVPDRDGNGNVVFSPGNMSVVFRVKSEDGRKYALKCFTRDNPYRTRTFHCIAEYFAGHEPDTHLTLPVYLENEINMFDTDGNPVCLPVLVSQWIEGVPLSEKIRRCIYFGDRQRLSELTDRFAELTIRMYEAEYAHGDIKPDNIIVTPDDRLKLIDIDSLFTPNNIYGCSPDAGTPGYQHPERDSAFFNSRTDDYSLLIILTSLIILEKEPSLHDRFSNGVNLLFDPRGIPGNGCPAYTYAASHFFEDIILNRLIKALKSRTPAVRDLYDLLQLVYRTRSGQRGVSGHGIPELYADERGKCGYRFADGEYLARALFDDAESFGDGLAPVCLDRKWAYMNVSGHIVTSFIYDRAQVFKGGYAAALKEGKWQILDTTLNVVGETVADHVEPFFDGLAAVCRDGRYGFINHLGETVIDTEFECVKPFRAERSVVCRNGKWGIIDRKGRYVIPPRHHSIIRSEEGKYEMDFLK